MKTYFEEMSSLAEDESSRPPIIFLHGIFMWSKVWKKAAPLITKKTGRKAYLLDARNHGKSVWSNEMSFDLLLADLVEFMDALDIQRAVIVGNSMGGRTAMNFALKYPDRVEALVVEDMTPRNVISGNNTVVQMFADTVLQLLATYPPEMKQEEMKQKFIEDLLLIVSPFLIDKEKGLKNIDGEMIPVMKEGGAFRPSMNMDVVLPFLKSNFLVQDLPKKNLVFNGDALFIYGSKGLFNLHKDITVKELFPRAIIRRVEGSSHCIHMDSPQEYADIVSEFILRRDRIQSKY